jgi:uncharacterized membrane protein
MSTIILLLTSLLLLVLAWLMPTLGRPTLQFGVRVPADHAGDRVITAARGMYRRWMALAGGAVEIGAAGLAIGFGRPAWAAGVAVGAFGAVFLVFAAGYLGARHRILAAKQREGWYAGRRQGIAVDTSLHSEPEPVPWRWMLPALLVVVVTLVIGVVRYPAMPAMLASRYHADGATRHLVAKSVSVAFEPVFIQIGMTALILVLTLVIFRARPDIDAAAPATSARRHRIFLTRMAKGLFVLAASINLSMAVTAWFVWTGATSQPAVIAAPSLAGIVIVLTVAIRTGQEGSRVPVSTQEDPVPALVQRDDDALWRGGLVYVNPDDPAVFVPKRFGVGWAVNFGNWLAWILVVAIVGAIVAMLVLLD